MSGPPSDLVEQLYRTPPDKFVTVRDTAAAQARRAGDPRTAREIARLRRPTVAAWLVNLLALERPELVADLTQLAESLREAQRELRGPRLRELSAQRRAVVGALVAEVRRLAADAEGGPSGGKLPLAEVEATLNAALSDVDVAEQVRSGRLLRSVHYAGFGEVPRPQLRLVTGGEEPPAAAPARQRVPDRGALRAEQAERAARADRARRRKAVAKELARARTDQERAETELADAVAAERDGAAALDAVETELAELERRRAIAEQELSRSRLARRAAERAASVARRRSGEVEAAMEALDAEQGDAEESDSPAD
ncbi:hypothetical protein SAMN05443287_105209 [Micromonospora phaseoli]|uniref:Uncharacterized protein n=1 Tax=Micromonospora phaseoli TaxID=1144548 RepID=A0A1H6ZNS9_9ACTN|nr:hypothetical protein [Micromonospora phaseoli]PZV97096.1 hypothetical protein CLV64_106204 [Micromonospora phaseoli]GIJ77324.1 hypothetical protein Xph01_17560 [Micromonospora phaseoli]SEJ55041.1 hypothetical protein SAMN05443287_105209 [Micromonospora phaseoli]